MGKSYNVNDNVTLRESYNVNDNVRRSSIKERARMVDNIADHLVYKFKAPNSRNFFCKCAWKLSEDDIWTAYEKAHSPKIEYPLKYFITLCQIKMSKTS